MTYFVLGSAPLGVDVLEFFMSLDLPIIEGYGLSESLSISSLNILEPKRLKIGSVGKVRTFVTDGSQLRYV